MVEEPFNPFSGHGVPGTYIYKQPLFYTSNYTQTTPLNKNNITSDNINYNTDYYQQKNYYVCSPPMASSDELSDSEISDLERQFANSYLNNKDNIAKPHYQQQNLRNIIGSTSMPSFNRYFEQKTKYKPNRMSNSYSQQGVQIKPNCNLMRSATMFEVNSN